MHTLFITIKFVSQSQQMRAKKKKKKKSRKREAENVDTEPKRSLYFSNLLHKRTDKERDPRS